MLFSAEEIAGLAGEMPSDEAAPDSWQPSSTLYGGAHLFGRAAVEKVGRVACAVLERHAPDGATLARVMGWRDVDAARIHGRLAEKLQTCPVEDMRIDFEDGYGVRPDDEEDRDATRTATEAAAAWEAGVAPRRLGVRPRAFTRSAFARSVRTLDLFFSTLAGRGAPPPGFVVTLPKVRGDEEVVLLGRVLAATEQRLGWARRSLGAELMLETPRAIVDARGGSPLPRWVELLEGRLVGVHLGSYDLTAALDVAAPDQEASHAACDLARIHAKLALAGTGVHVSDGATTVLPVARHRAPASEGEARENDEVIQGALRLHARNVRAALALGIHQGWDLHPAQLVARYAALMAFYAEALPRMTARLSNFLAAEERATRVGETFDDAATGAGLRGFFRRGIACGAIDAESMPGAK